MTLNLKYFEEILKSLQDDSYVGDNGKALKFERIEIQNMIRHSFMAKHFAKFAAEIFKAGPEIPTLVENFLVLGILIGMKYKEKELAKDASKQRIVT